MKSRKGFRKFLICDDNEKLTSGHRKNNFVFVMIIFLFFSKSKIKIFKHYIKNDDK